MNIPTREEIKKAIYWARSTQKGYGQCSGMHCDLRYHIRIEKFFIVELGQNEYAPLSDEEAHIDFSPYIGDIDTLINAAEKAISEKQAAK